MVEGARLEIVWAAKSRRFESSRFRQTSLAFATRPKGRTLPPVFNFGDKMNQAIFEFFGVNETWEKITDVLLVAVILILGVFAVLGLVQWIQRKDIRKVDKELLFMLPSLFLIVVIYFVFAKVWIINYRPVLIDGVAEPSFPSSHALVAVTVLSMVMKALPKYVSDKRVRVIIDVLMVIIMGLIAFGRVAAGMHWLTDVLGGIIFGWVLGLVYQLLLKKFGEDKNE